MNTTRSRYLPILLAGLMSCPLFFLAGCAAHKPKPVAMPVITRPPLSVLRERDIRYFRDLGVKVRHVGQTITLFIPSDQIFRPDSANLYGRYIPALSQVVRLVALYDVSQLKIAVYRDNAAPYGAPAGHLWALSRRQGEIVSDYLVRHGVGANVIMVAGHGDKNPVAMNQLPLGASINRRVVIEFRYTSHLPRYA